MPRRQKETRGRTIPNIPVQCSLFPLPTLPPSPFTRSIAVRAYCAYACKVRKDKFLKRFPFESDASASAVPRPLPSPSACFLLPSPFPHLAGSLYSSFHSPRTRFSQREHFAFCKYLWKDCCMIYDNDNLACTMTCKKYELIYSKQIFNSHCDSGTQRCTTLPDAA